MYRYSKEATSITTFKCESCGKRVRANKLYGRTNVLTLNKGIAYKRNGKNEIVIIAMTCSKSCSHKVKPSLIVDLLCK